MQASLNPSTLQPFSACGRR